MNPQPPLGPLDRAPTSTLSIIVATALLAGTIGYFIGTGSSLGIFPSPSSSAPYPSSKDKKKKSWPNSYDVNVHLDSSDEELMAQQRRGAGEESDGSDSEGNSEDEGAGTLKGEFEGHETEEVKLVLCVRTDLGMGKGMAQSLQCFNAMV
jgi:peptidyl-tRNA hydrolase, PTH2 family